ncbi:MAG TPA: T9SS type A sorting domain-containing protein [Bacteroidales bacterium]|nr:T9SS type A sorting domain-containing protein [Bacteroidales bacterium]
MKTKQTKQTKQTKHIVQYIVALCVSVCGFSMLMPIHAQIENVIVETYYVSNAADATVTDGGSVPEGSVTYRVFIDLAKGSKLLGLFADEHHRLFIASDDFVYNNTLDGVSIAKDLNKYRYSENTVALDSWLTLGQMSFSSSKTYGGVLKQNDTDGSKVGGKNNDYNILINTDERAGIPITQADGMMIMSNVPDDSWIIYGLKDPLSGKDSTIFGSLKKGKEFESYDFLLKCSGVQGLDSLNHVLVAQITTKGEIEFELNAEVETADGKIIKYVAVNGGQLGSDIKLSPYLKYPQECGCTDRNYLEFDEKYSCSEPSACKTPIVLGCMDTYACNFDATANVHIQNMCCYPGFCFDKDIQLVCPQFNAQPLVYMYPNPTKNNLTLKVLSPEETEMSYKILDDMGSVQMQKENIKLGNFYTNSLQIGQLKSGIYHCVITIGNYTEFRTIIKE